MSYSVGVVMGSASDYPVMNDAVRILERFGVAHEVHVVSAHRTPEAMMEYGRSARERGLGAIIAGAGGSAHLPGMLAAVTTVPVIGVPVELARLDGLDSLLSIVQMPKGVPVATVAIKWIASSDGFFGYLHVAPCRKLGNEITKRQRLHFAGNCNAGLVAVGIGNGRRTAAVFFFIVVNEAHVQ